jgi:exopolysaccharide biosynthesis protein
MPWFRAVIILLLLSLITSLNYASGYTYEQRETNAEVVHILIINPKDYQIDLVKANDGVGRETVSAMAARSKAEIAINGGFFNINSNKDKDGTPSGTLVIKGHVYHIKNQQQALVVIKPNKFSIVRAYPKNYLSPDVSIVSGIPLLISNNYIPQELKNKTSDFYIGQHARTALGIKSDGSIVIVVVEHRTKGLSMLELAQLMKSLGCQYAINLDGGGSSTLYIKGEVVNQTMGDMDEGNGLQILRPVSDAIVFKSYH